MAGKFAGWGERILDVPCWSRQTKFIARGDEYGEFHISPSDKSIEEEIEDLSQTDEATKADMVVAIHACITKSIKEMKLKNSWPMNEKNGTKNLNSTR